MLFNCVLNIAFDIVVVQVGNWLNISTATSMMAYMAALSVIFAGACYAATGYILNKELSL